jgi:hypothetical protein
MRPIMMSRASGPVCLVLLLAVASGCTAAKASIQTVAAEESLRKAKEYEADQIAAYEYTMALRYLEKAREEIGYSQFRMADALARQSAEWSDRAIIFTEKRGRSEINLSDFQEAPAPAPEPAPAPAPPAPVDPDMMDILGPSPAPAPAPAPVPDPELDEILGIPPAPGPAPAPEPEPEIDLDDDE